MFSHMHSRKNHKVEYYYNVTTELQWLTTPPWHSSHLLPVFVGNNVHSQPISPFPLSFQKIINEERSTDLSTKNRKM
jgi:hypothetical protein